LGVYDEGPRESSPWLRYRVTYKDGGPKGKPSFFIFVWKKGGAGKLGQALHTRIKSTVETVPLRLYRHFGTQIVPPLTTSGPFTGAGLWV
jgi:hypothetical protein